MANENRTYDLKVEKVVEKSSADVFRAIGEGRLFTNCSADHESLMIDFKVGGKYSIQFLAHNMKNHGEFLEIIPNQKIVFTWCQDYDSNPTPDTKVSIELKDLGGRTALTLIHSGFSDLENKEAHQGGWNGGLDDLIAEISIGKLRLSRKVSKPLNELFEICKNPKSFFAFFGDVNNGKFNSGVGAHFEMPTQKGKVNGDYLEIVPNQKIKVSWKSSPYGESLASDTHVTLLFETEDDKSSWIELLHEGLVAESSQKVHRAGWDAFLKRLLELN